MIIILLSDTWTFRKCPYPFNTSLIFLSLFSRRIISLILSIIFLSSIFFFLSGCLQNISLFSLTIFCRLGLPAFTHTYVNHWGSKIMSVDLFYPKITKKKMQVERERDPNPCFALFVPIYIWASSSTIVISHHNIAFFALCVLVYLLDLQK